MRPAIALLSLLVLAACATREKPEPAMPTFTNPVFLENFPDPGAVPADGTWYAYGTNNATANVPILTSPDLVTWNPAGDALPDVGGWAERGNTWAPEVIAGDGGYLLYYTARKAGGRQCIGVAYARTPAGPFTDDRTGPLICQADEGGSIDASPYRDPDGGLWLYWKNDGNAIGRPTHLYGSRLAADGRSLTGDSVRLLSNDAAWENHVVEAPQMVRHDGKLFLFYSANAFDLPGQHARRRDMAAVPRVAAGRDRQRGARPAALAGPGRVARRPARGEGAVAGPAADAAVALSAPRRRRWWRPRSRG
ncbi:glycosyl hydrolase family 43 [Pseudosporangium ferrugineum]|uniref:Glycosyl hydrolase family 43 n=1 Tax=Pseudosporangium ferrugineum TaxID=439699 RepID=A0A2T0S4P2_9ACTN|nr:glycosyl hydrolase family 43 [Pseudosporangium ferrugineum]